MEIKSKCIAATWAFLAVMFFCPGPAPGQAGIDGQPCSHAVKVLDKRELLDVIGGLKWNYTGPYSSKSLGASTDIEIAGALALSAKDLPVAGTCLKRDDCRHIVTMNIPKDLRGVTCVETEKVLGADHCALAKMDKTTIRLRGKLMDTHPWKWNFVPVLDFLPPCSQQCKAGEIRCGADGTCWSGFNGYCRNCLELPAERCACLNETGPLPEGSRCSFFISGDVVCAGECRSGVCAPPAAQGGNCGPCCR